MQLLPKQRDLYDSMFSFVNSICAINSQQLNEISLLCIRAGLRPNLEDLLLGAHAYANYKLTILAWWQEHF